jgi:hypothetical protein
MSIEEITHARLSQEQRSKCYWYNLISKETFGEAGRRLLLGASSSENQPLISKSNLLESSKAAHKEPNKTYLLEDRLDIESPMCLFRCFCDPVWI